MTQDEKEIADLAILKTAANRLNDMVRTDTETMYHIFSPMWVCDPKLSETSAVCIPINEKAIAVNVLGIIIGTLPIQTNTYTLAIEIIGRKLVGFKVVNCKIVETDKQD